MRMMDLSVVQAHYNEKNIRSVDFHRIGENQ